MFLKSDKSFEINEISQIPVVLNQNEYNYYLSLLSFSFLNCSPNIVKVNGKNQTFTFKYTQTPYPSEEIPNPDPVVMTVQKEIEPGLYDTQDIIDLLNSFMLISQTNPSTGTTMEGQASSISINPFTEYTELDFSTSEASKVRVSKVEIIVDAQSILHNDLFRIPLQTISLIQGNPHFKSSIAFRISTYNNVMLTSSSFGITSLYGNETSTTSNSSGSSSYNGMKGLTTSSAMYVISSVASPYSMIDYTAIIPIDFLLSGPTLTNFQFKLVDENNNDLVLLDNATPDFSVKLAIKRMPKRR